MVEGLIPSCWAPSYARGLSVLLVDHDKTSLTYLGSMLKQYSYTVTTSILATDALSILQEEKGKFKLIMASVNMPDMDTISFLRQLLQNDLPVILIAPERSVPAAIEALGEGASFYLGKPISMDDLKYIWQHVFINKRKRSVDGHGNPNNEENSKFAKTSNRSIIRDMLNNTYKATTTGDQIQHYNGVNMYKDLAEPSNILYLHETTIDCYDLKGKGKLVTEDKRNKKDLGILSNETQGNNKSNMCTAEKNFKDNVGRESIGNDLLKKKPRVIWSPELHLKFIAAVSKLGDKKARPKYILKAMNVPGLTHRQVASHLQKFKSQVDKIFKASERLDAETLRYHCTRFLTVSKILDSSNALLHALQKKTSRLITIYKEAQNKEQQTNSLTSTETISGIHAASAQASSGNVPNATKSPTLNEINQAHGPMVEAFPSTNKVPGEDNFLTDFGDMDVDALEAFYNFTLDHLNNADKSLKSFGEVSAMATHNLSSEIKPNAENELLADDFLVDVWDKNPESYTKEVKYNLHCPSTGKLPLSDFDELLNALEIEAHSLESEAIGPTQGDVDRYCELLENVFTQRSPQ